VRCPWGCRRLHIHGWPYELGDAAPGFRVSHCQGQGLRHGQYWIAAPGDEEGAA
jgi:hypothetical protein